MGIFDRFFRKKEKEGIEVKNLTNSTVNIFKSDEINFSSIFSNNPYNDVIIESPYAYNSSLAILATNISNRAKTIKSISENWNTKTWLNIHGGYDTGKSQLSLLISNQLNYTSLSFSFKDLSQDEFKNVIVLVLKQILANNLEQKSYQLILFDDIPQLGFDDNINKLFVQLLIYCQDNNIKILSTSNHKINHKIIELIKDSFVELPIPLLNKEEIEEIISTYKKEESALKYSTIIETISSGYPIYVQIICQYLERQNWILSDDELTKFISGKAFIELDDETYQKLLHTTQNDYARDILYRLNIISGIISNETIEIVSNVNPVINSPFEKINSLSGTWLQKNNDETYFISPLIKRLGSSNVQYETRKEINNKLAQNILSKKNLSQFDSQRAITYFLAGESYDDAGMIMIMTLQLYFKNPEIFTDTIFGFFWINTVLPEQMPIVIKASIRVLQLHIFNDLQVKKHPKFKNDDKQFVRTDLEDLIKIEAQFPEELISLAKLILFKSYIEDDIKQSLNHIVSISKLDFGKIDDEEQHLYNDIWILLDKIYSLDEIEKWFEAYRQIGKSEESYDSNIIHLFSRRLFDNILSINKDWNDTISILDSIESKAISNNLEILGAYSAKTKILVLVEKLGDLSGAENYFEKAKELFKKPEAIFFIKDEIGRQQFYKGQEEKALLNLLDVEDVNISTVTKLDTYLTLAKIFGKNDVKLAHTYTKKALDYSQNNIEVSKLTFAKLTGEYGLSFWFLGDYKTAIYTLAESYELLLSSYKQIDNFDNIDDYNIGVVQTGNTLNYFYQILTIGRPPEKASNGSDYVIPSRGFFNNNYDSKLLKEWYYEERKYMNIYIFVQSFEYFNDRENAIKWANYAFEINKEITLYTFKNTLRSFNAYKILENKYQESIEMEEELNQYESTLNIQTADKIKNAQQKTFFLELIERTPTSKDTDDYYLTYNLIPILIRELTLFLENKNTVSQIVLRLKDYLSKNDSFYTDKKTIEAIIFMLDNFPQDYSTYNKLVKWISDVETENKKPIQIICYLICSLQASTKDALSLHFAFMPYLEKAFSGLSKGTHLFILYPFVCKFWTSRILTYPQDFYFIELWQTNLTRSMNAKNEYKIIAIYSLISMHLAHRPNDIEQKWMQPYIDFVIKTNRTF